MKQFRTIFGFEYRSYAKNKVFVGLTLTMLILMAAVLFFPRFFGSSESPLPDSMTDLGGKRFAVASRDEDLGKLYTEALRASLAGCTVTEAEADENALKAAVDDETYDFALIFEGGLSYKYIVKNASVMDMTPGVIDGILTAAYQSVQLSAAGLSPQQAEGILTAAPQRTDVITGKDQSSSIMYTYILMFLLYMSVLMYGSLVAQSVATEKSSRAMELLITSAKPSALMFGKVLGAGAAGLTQLVLVLGGAVVFYKINAAYWADNFLVQTIFDMSLPLVLYTVLFFVLGYLIYSFMFGALASLASKLEDVNTLVMPATLLMVISFMITMFSILNDVDNMILKVASFIPFTAPMAMFTRIAMGSVAPWEIAVSVALLVVSTVGIGYLAAGIYKVGVLMYGKPPKPHELFKVLRKSRK